MDEDGNYLTLEEQIERHKAVVDELIDENQQALADAPFFTLDIAYWLGYK